MSIIRRTLYEGKGELDDYTVMETVYKGRFARVLLSGQQDAAQSSIPLDGDDTMLFDYNQRFLELAEQLKPKRVLCIGGGGCTLPVAIHTLFPQTKIDVVEPDGALHYIAREYFGLGPWPEITTYRADGRAFAAAATAQYDLIIIDAFSDLVIPRSLVTAEAVAAFTHILTHDGVIAMNVIAAYHGRSAIILERLTAAYKTHYETVQLFVADIGFSDWQSQNYILTAHNSHKQLAQFMRYTEKPLPHVEAAFALHD